MKIIMKGGGKRLLDKKDYSLDIKINILYAKEPIHQKQLTIINAYVPKKIHEGKLTEFATVRPAVKEMLEGVYQAAEKWYQREILQLQE